MKKKATMKNILFISICTLLLFSCINLNGNSENYVYSEKDPISGQLHTAERLREYMDKKEYENANNLFSTKYQIDVLALQEYPQMLQVWSSPWTFDDAKFERYIAKIKDGKAPFVFENNEWKINEN